jgi:hypothetical protein
MKKCLLYGNCQAQEVAKVLSEHKAFSEAYSVEYVCNYDSGTRGIALPTAEISEADVLVFQPIRGVGIFTKEGCTRISFPYIYNSGVFAMYEEDDYVHGAEQIRKMKWLKIPEDIAVDIAVGGRLFFDLKYRFDESLNRMHRKETDCNIKLTFTIMQNIKRVPVFFTQNHVSNIILFQVINGVLGSLGFQTIPESDYGPERMSAGAWPVSPYDVAELGLFYRSSDGWEAYMERCIRRIYSGDEK